MSSNATINLFLSSLDFAKRTRADDQPGRHPRITVAAAGVLLSSPASWPGLRLTQYSIRYWQRCSLVSRRLAAYSHTHTTTQTAPEIQLAVTRHFGSLNSFACRWPRIFRSAVPVGSECRIPIRDGISHRLEEHKLGLPTKLALAVSLNAYRFSDLRLLCYG